MKRALFALALAFAMVPAKAAPAAEMASPGKVLAVQVEIDGDGRPLYTITRNGKPVIAPSRLGFLLTDQPKLERNFKLDSVETASHDDTWEQPWGEWRFIRNHYN